MNKIRIISDLAVNLAIAVFTVMAVYNYFSGGPDALGSVNTQTFRYFTTDSNLLMAVIALVYAGFNVLCLFRPETAEPKWLHILKFTGTTAVSVTFVTVVIFLGPTAAMKSGARGYFRMFEGNVFFLHFLCPLLAIVSFTLLERGPRLSVIETLWALIPTVVYSIIYYIMVVKAARPWPDFYGFTFGGKMWAVPFSVLGMYTLTFGLATLLRISGPLIK